MESLAAQVGNALKAQGMMLVTAESCTGGGVAQAITEIAGSSAWFERGFVTYSNTSKVEMLGVRQATLDKHGAVSEATVREMVEGGLTHSHGHIALSITGIAGPDGGTHDKPVGTVWFAWGIKHGTSIARVHHLQGTRAEIRAQAVTIALQGILEILASHTQLA